MGELMSVLDLLRATKGEDEPLRILCDSQYAINCCTRWIPSWKKRGWRKSDNKPVLNLDLLKQLDEELAGRRVSFQWVKGHAGHPLNEKADDLARAAATAYQQGTRVATGPGFSRTPVPLFEDGELDGAEGAEPRRPSRAEPGQPVEARTSAASPERQDEDALIPLPDDMVLPLPPDPLTRPQPDLLSIPYIVRNSPRPETALVVDVTELTRELLSDETQLDRSRLDELMHPDFVAHMPGGVIRTKGSIMARPASLSGGIQLDVLGADLLGQDYILLRHKLKRNSQDYLCAILWQRVGHGWQARFHAFTPITT